MRNLWRTALLIEISLMAAVLVQGQNLNPNGTKAGYVGSTTCKTCHPDVWFRFYKNAHFKSVASGKETPENTGCEGCHGPGAAHVKASGGKATIVAFSVLGTKETVAACLRCHGSDLARTNIHASLHTQNGVSCTQCHSV